ncbi:MAG TPA: peptide deformylase [Acidimicrobiales bacterium]|nr:peptide deformylase [Acidimicrobiales bacterium]
MSIRKIRLFGDPVLKTPASPVTDFDRSLRRLVSDLTDTMIDEEGAGLAAPQIGVGLRVFTFVYRDDEDGPTIGHLVNPRLVELSADDLEDDVEGCLSFPGRGYTLARPRRAVAEGFDVHGTPVRVVGDGRLARALQHETDHLDGILFIDRLEGDQRRQAMADLREMLMAGDDVTVKVSPH